MPQGKQYAASVSGAYFLVNVEEVDQTHWEVTDVWLCVFAKEGHAPGKTCISQIVFDHPDLFASITKEIEDQRSREV